MRALGLHLGLTRPSGGGGTPTPPAAEYAHLASATQTAITSFITDYEADEWSPDIDNIVWDDTITLTSSTSLRSWLIGTSSVESQPNRNEDRNQRVVLSVGGTWTYANRSQVESRAGNWKDNGKVCLIEPASGTIEMSSRFRLIGTRGVYIRNINFTHDVALSTPTYATFAPVTLQGITITNGGTGYLVGDALTFTGTYDVAPVATVASVSGGAITGISITNRGKIIYDTTAGNVTTITAIGVTSAGGSGAVLAVPAMSANPRDTQTIIADRSASFPLLTVAIFDNCGVGPATAASPITDFKRFPTAVEANNIEQLTMKNCRFWGYQTALKGVSVRRYRAISCDWRYGIADSFITLNTTPTLSVGGVAWDAAFPDKICFTWNRLPTVRDLVDDCAAVNADGYEMRLDQEHTDLLLQNGTGFDAGGYRSLVQFGIAYGRRATYEDRNGAGRNNSAASIRVTGGTQGMYLDDCASTHNTDLIAHDVAVAPQTSLAFVTYNGTQRFDRVSQFRPAVLAPSATVPTDGFNYSQDIGATTRLRKKDGSASSAVHFINSIIGAYGNYAAPADATLVTDSGNQTVDPTIGAAAGDKMSARFSGTFGVDSEGRQTYTDTALIDAASVSAFRSAAWAVIAPVTSGKGISNPAGWPAS